MSGPIDRISPTRRPAGLAVMRQRWMDLLFLHWAVNPSQLRPLVPPGLELDLFEDQAFVGLVVFTMTGVRPVGLPALRGLSDFHETNVRTYVHYQGSDPGVWFFSLDAANSIAVRLARFLFHLPYHRSVMLLEREELDQRGEPVIITGAGVRRWPGPVPAAYVVRAQTAGPASPAVPGTLEHFLAERYILYTCRNHQLLRGRVHHRPYPLQPASVLSIDETLLAAAAIERHHATPLAHFAAGVDVEVFPLSSTAKGDPSTRLPGDVGLP